MLCNESPARKGTDDPKHTFLDVRNTGLETQELPMKITGKFDVKLNPMECFAEGVEGARLGRMSIDKIFHGALSAQSKGEMLNVLTSIQGSAGYVAIEQVVGELSGKNGSFVLQHYGIMSSGNNTLTLQVVPDSGSGELTGLTGTMAIRVEDGQHYYDFDYEQA